jgi:hypothetical protein
MTNITKDTADQLKIKMQDQKIDEIKAYILKRLYSVGATNVQAIQFWANLDRKWYLSDDIKLAMYELVESKLASFQFHDHSRKGEYVEIIDHKK